MANVTELRVALTVPDFGQALTFYRDMLGLEQIADWCSGARRGMSPVILTLLAAWLLLFVLHLGAFAWPGRVAIFLAIFAAVRWLLRRLFDFGRTGFLGGRRCRGGR